jgi:hypothetical protein
MTPSTGAVSLAGLPKDVCGQKCQYFWGFGTPVAIHS